MKKILTISLIFLPLVMIAQTKFIEIKNGADTLYTASGFKFYSGQTVKLGNGTMPDGNFKYIEITETSIAHHGSFLGNQNTYANQANSLPRKFSGMTAQILRIDVRGDKKSGYSYYPIIKYEPKYQIDADNAIAAGEIIVPEEFRPKQKTLTGELKQNNASVADELIKLKKLKDDGVISEEEFQAQKKKLLDK